MNDKNVNVRGVAIIGVACIGLAAMMGLAGCEQKQPQMEAKQETPAPKVETAPAGEAKTEISATETAATLKAPEDSAGRAENMEGVAHAQQGHWDVAEGYFRKALEADPKLAEAQFNLGLALSKQDKHDEATAAFKKAAEMAPDNTMITESPILKKHTSS
ncbi:MAG: tetratricopeptide repeat protein [Nitrospira sp.]|nr:tetratricopeptide repeat protein [Nitrospira sp.]MDH5499311.1 tetratricopeptide repeat protein [Nitrospira sp.]MDH5726712.1 tetratricopeptide repeat protein [Nitrospira sp.]